jgi:gas vesicle protein
MNNSFGNMSMNSANNDSVDPSNQGRNVKDILKESVSNNETLAKDFIKLLKQLKLDLEKCKNKSGKNLDSKKVKKILSDLMEGIIQVMDDNPEELKTINSAISFLKH